MCRGRNTPCSLQQTICVRGQPAAMHRHGVGGGGGRHALRSFQNSCATAAIMWGSSLQRFSASVDFDLRWGRGASAIASALSTPDVGHSCRAHLSDQRIPHASVGISQTHYRPLCHAQ